jgi:hypothetical protein
MAGLREQWEGVKRRRRQTRARQEQWADEGELPFDVRVEEELDLEALGLMRLVQEVSLVSAAASAW